MEISSIYYYFEFIYILSIFTITDLVGVKNTFHHGSISFRNSVYRIVGKRLRVSHEGY